MRYFTDRIAVLHKGQIVELAETEELITNARHPYTKALLSAIPMPDPIHEREKKHQIYDPSIHDYETNPPSWQEVSPGHFLLANDREIREGFGK
jgi:oligopeptide transport system ATP-binding protein